MTIFDPYHKWLGIPAAEQPVNHYRLLGLTLFESDPDVIDAATEQRITFLRQCATGEHVAESQKLLNEVANARLHLVNAQRKSEYDERLRKSLTPTKPQSSRTTSVTSLIQSKPKELAAIGGILALLVLLLALLNSTPMNSTPNDRDARTDDSRESTDAKNSAEPQSRQDTVGEQTDRHAANPGEPEEGRPTLGEAADRMPSRKWQHLILDDATVEDDFLRLREDKRVFTKQQHTGPIEINVTARTDRLNIRLHAYRGSVVIFNWETNPHELRVLRPDGGIHLETGSLARANVTPLRTNTWYKLKWQIRDDGMAVFVDAQQVFAEKRTYDLSVATRIAVGSANSIVDIRDFQVEPLSVAVVGAASEREREDNGLKVKFCWCPPGTFTMGSPTKEPTRVDDEDQVSVTLTNGFWMGKFEVTQAEWESVMGTKLPQQQAKASASELRGYGPRFPMYWASHDEATEFCQKLTETERAANRLPSGFVYRLPTEAEWEYACRAGTTTATAFGNSLSSTQANFNGTYPFNGGAKGVNRQTTLEVGSLPANAWGLHEMHGNVFEWCLDSVKKLSGGNDPIVHPSSQESPRVFRGGSWRHDGGYCRSADRNWNVPGSRSDDLGFRVALSHE